MRGRPIKGSDIHLEEVAMLCQGDEVYGIGTILKLYAQHAPGLQFLCLGRGPLFNWLCEHNKKVELLEGLKHFTARGSLTTLLRLPIVMRQAKRDAFSLDQIFKPKGIRIVHTHWMPQQLIAGYMRQLGYLSVWQINNNMNPNRLFGIGVKFNHCLANWGADLLLPASDFIAANWHGITPPIRTVHNAATHFYETPNQLPPNPIRCLTAGRLTESKGHHLAIEAVITARQANLNVKLDIFGGPVDANPYAEQLRHTIHQANAQDHIRIMGFAKNLRQRHQDYHLGLQCRIDPEPCSLWVCETHRDGLPLIASASGGTPELVNDNVTGLLFVPGNAQDLAEKLILLARNPDRINIMRQAAFERGRKHFSLDRFVSQTLEGYAQICEGSPPPT